MEIAFSFHPSTKPGAYCSLNSSYKSLDRPRDHFQQNEHRAVLGPGLKAKLSDVANTEWKHAKPQFMYSPS